MSPAAVLHVTSLPGGGVDRHIRDIARAGGRRHLIWHVADGADAIEMAGEGAIHAVDSAALDHDAGALATWLAAQGVGVVHVHSLGAAVRRRARWAAQALGVARIATLHDILFLRAEGFEPGAPREPDPAWLTQTSEFLASCAARIVPSEYLAGVAAKYLALPVDVVPNGSPTCAPSKVALEPRPEFVARRHGRVAAVLGAIGPHKGARVLEDAATLLEGSDIDIVVIGYLDARITPEWHQPHLFVHGGYNDEDVRGWLEAYGAGLALFPNQVPESFSYALSDLWTAGMPALVPGNGALGERVARHGGGWHLPDDFGARDVADALVRLLSPAGETELARVRSELMQDDPGRVPPLEPMTRSLDALYSRYGLEPSGTVDARSAPAQRLLADNLDGALFRRELVRLATDMAQQQVLAAAFEREAHAWIAKLEHDVATLNAELAREVAERRRLGGEVLNLEGYRRAMSLLPGRIRRWLKKIADARR